MKRFVWPIVCMVVAVSAMAWTVSLGLNGLVSVGMPHWALAPLAIFSATAGVLAVGFAIERWPGIVRFLFGDTFE